MNQNRLFKIVLAVAVVVSGIMYAVLPHFVRYNTLREQGLSYVPVTQESNFDMMNVQAGRYRDIVDGKIFSGEIDTYEHKDGPALWPLLSAAVMAPFFAPFETIFPGIIITDFIFPILIFISFYLLLYMLTRQKLFALFSAIILVLFPQIAHYIPPSSFTELRLFFSQFSPVPIQNTFTASLSYLTREAFIPGASFFLLSLFFTYKATRAGTKRKCFIALAGVFYGTLFYLYFYFWAFFTVFLGLFFFALLLGKHKEESHAILAIGVIGLTVSIPFWVSHFNLAALPNYQELIGRMGPELGHGFRWFLWKSYIVVFLMTLGALWTGKKFNRPVLGLFLAALAVAEIVVLNEQVITGFNIQSDHWATRVFLMTRGIILFTLFYYAILHFKNRIKILRYSSVFVVLGTMLVFFLFSNIIYTEIAEAKKYAHVYTVPENIMHAYEWLNENTLEDSVILTPALQTNIDISVYTHNRIFLARANNSLATEEEFLSRLYSAYSLLSVSPEYFYNMIQSSAGIKYFFSHKYASRDTDAYLKAHDVVVLPDSILEKKLNEYIFFNPLETLSYRMDYIFIGPREKNVDFNSDVLEKYNRVYDKNNIEIYEVGGGI